MKRKRQTADQLIAKRRKAERKAGIIRDPLSAACPFSTRLAREGFPHGKTRASRTSVGLDTEAPPTR